MADKEKECDFTAGTIAGAVIGTFVATLVLLGIIWLVYSKTKKRKLQRSGLSNLVIVEEGRPEKGNTYDNPGFVEDSSDAKKTQPKSGDDIKQNGSGKPISSQDGGKKMPWGPFRFLFKSRTALDDSVMEEPQRYNVALKGHDFTGLGFNICGNMKDGIFVKDVMQRGPAAESKHILPGDQITSMTVSFKHMVLEDAITLLSYASPYEVSLEMMRHADKSLHHKGLLVSTSAHPSGSGQSNTLERVCHPFFKSQSIDDLRKVGKEHLDQQVSRVRKQNGVHTKHSSPTTMDVPTVVVVGTNEARVSSSSSSHQKSPQPAVNLPNVNLALAKGTSKISQEAHQTQIPSMSSVDEVDSPRGPIVPEIKVSAKMSKPEIIPRAKAKVTNVQKAPELQIHSSSKVVEAISPVVKMSADFEKMVQEHSIQPKSAVIDMEPMDMNTSMKMQTEIEMPNIEDGMAKIEEKMPSMLMKGEHEMKEMKTPHVEIEMGQPELSLMGKDTNQEESPVKKPQRGQKKDKEKEKADKNKEKEAKKAEKDKQKEQLESESGEKSKFGKFGFNLPDISLNFGKGTKSEEKDKSKPETDDTEGEQMETKGKSESDLKQKKDKVKGKDKKEKEITPKTKSGTSASPEDANETEVVPMAEDQHEKKPLEKSSSSGFGFHLKFPSFDKPLLKRKDSKDSSGSGEKGGEMMVGNDPGATATTTTNKESPTKPPKTKKEKAPKTKEPKEDRPTSPIEKKSKSKDLEKEDPENNEIQQSPDGVDPEKKKSVGFHMPHLGIKLPKFGHSKQYSFENVGDSPGKESKQYQSEIPKTLEESMPSSKVELTADTQDLMKTKSIVHEVKDEVVMKMKTSATSIPVPSPQVYSGDGDRAYSPSYGLYPPSLNEETVQDGVKVVEMEQKLMSVSLVKSSNQDDSKEDKMKSDESQDKDGKGEKFENKPGFVSKGLKGLRDLKDKVTGKHSHDIQDKHMSSSEDEADAGPGPGAGADEQSKLAAKEKAKKDKKLAKEAREKAAAEAKKEKERLKAEKKAKKLEEAELKKKSAAGGHSSDSSSSSSDESDFEDKDKKVKKEKKKSKKEKAAKLKKEGKEKESKKSVKKSTSPTPVETIEIDPERVQMSQSQSAPVTQDDGQEAGAKPPVAPRKSKEQKEKDKDQKDKEKKAKKSKDGKDKESSSSSSSSSSESDDDSKKEGKPKKPKRSAKRKAPVPPSMEKVENRMTITTSAEVISPPKDLSSTEVQVQVDAKTPESGRRSASFGDLSSLQPKAKMDNLERAMSMDMAGESEPMSPTSNGSNMPVASPLEDLSADPDPKVLLPHFNKHGANLKMPSSTSSSSSSETLKAAPTSVVHVYPKETLVVTHTNTESQLTVAPLADSQKISISGTSTDSSTDPNPILIVHSDQPKAEEPSEIRKMMDNTISMMNKMHKMDSPSLVKSVEEKSESRVTISTPESQPAPTSEESQSRPGSKVTISTTQQQQHHMSPVDKSEIERVAQEAVDEIISQVSLNGSAMEKAEERLNGGSSSSGDIPAPSSGLSVKVEGAMDMDVVEPSSTSTTGKNITIMNIKNVPEQDHLFEGDESASASSACDTKPALVLRGDSKSRLMQTVADANTIKVNPISPLRKDSSMSSSSSSVDSSPEVRTDPKPLFTPESSPSSNPPQNTNKEPTPTPGQIIEISPQELDGIMMSHADFLQKQASMAMGARVSISTPDSLDSQIKDASFDNWVYVEQKNAANELTCTHSHSDPEPSTSSSNDDDDIPYNRNGALSPTTYKMETEYKYATSEMQVTSSPLPPGDNTTTTTVYSTTMTLPQKTVTQITLGEPVVDSHGRIVSKITLESPTSTDTTNEADLPTLKPTK